MIQEKILIRQHIGHYTCLLSYLLWRIFKKPAKYLLLLVLALCVARVIQPVEKAETFVKTIKDLRISSVSQANQ